MEWIFVMFGAIFALLLGRSFVMVCFPDSQLAHWCEMELGFLDNGGPCGDGGGDSGGDGGDGGGD